MTRRERLERKAELRREWAEKRAANAQARFKAAHAAVEHIPFGQPILVGHHSEKRHRAALSKCDNNMRKGVEDSSMASHHVSKAGGIEHQLETSIFSDDPDAIEALQARIEELEAKRAEMKRLNAYWRKHGTMKGCAGVTDEAAAKLDADIPTRYTWERQPVPGYSLTNLGANIRRLKERIKHITARQKDSAKAEAAGGCVIEGDEYVRVIFAEKPEREVLTALKAANFHWGAGHWSGRRDKLPACVLALALMSAMQN